MELAQHRPADGLHFELSGATLIDVFFALKESHSEIFAAEFVSEFESAINRAAKRLKKGELMFAGPHQTGILDFGTGHY